MSVCNQSDLNRALARNLDAGFGPLVRCMQGDVYSAVLRSGAAPHDAEEAAAEAFFRAYRALRGYERERIEALRIRSWLVTIALNVWRNEIRRRSRHPELPLEATIEPSFAPDYRHVEGDAVGGLLAGLGDDQRTAVVLKHVLGFSYREIGEVMNMPEGTVKSHVSRGLESLRRSMEETGVRS